MFYDLFGDSICENDLDQAFKMLRPNPIKNWEEVKNPSFKSDTIKSLIKNFLLVLFCKRWFASVTH